MKKRFIFLTIGIILLAVSGVFALSIELIELSPELQGYVTSVVEKQGITTDKVTSVTKVDFNNLPEEIKLENIDETSLAIYQIDVVDGKPVYVITISDEIFKKTLETIDLKRSYLDFGLEGAAIGSTFLDTSTGVLTDLEKGYIMMRDGSITGISTNLEIVNASKEALIEIIIYKNGKPLGFGNTLSAASSGVKTDYDILSEGTILFESGDVISVYLKSEKSTVVWKDVITMIEITTD